MGLLSVFGESTKPLSVFIRKEGEKKGDISVPRGEQTNVYMVLHLVLLRPAPLRVQRLLVCSVLWGPLGTRGWASLKNQLRFRGCDIPHGN